MTAVITRYRAPTPISRPAGRVWPLQLIEGGLFLVLAAAALGAAAWLLHRRTS
jgi:hypothetical protein